MSARNPDQSANDQTCETMATTVLLAREWTAGDMPERTLQRLLAWVRLRMRAYDDGAESMREDYDGELWDRESMIEWIAADLAIDELDDAARLCEDAGWLEPTRVPPDAVPKDATPDPDCEMCEGAPPVVIDGVVQHCEGCCEPGARVEVASKGSD